VADQLWIYLPPISITAAADTTGYNTGNWTGTLSTSSMSLSYLTRFECYKMTIDGPIGFELSVYIDDKKWSHTAQGWANEWDPAHAMPLQAGMTIYLFWTAPTTTSPAPTATLWFRYDSSIAQVG